MVPKTYVTHQDDAWDAIAFRLWGQERHLLELVKANPEHLDVVLFPAGVELVVPVVPVTQQQLQLPPWRKL